MAERLFLNMEATAAVILFGIGFTMLLLHQNLIKKIMGMNIMDTAVYLFLAAKGYVEGRMVPIAVEGVTEVTAYINPVPSGLVLTGIVVSVSTTALMLALTKRLYERYGSLDLDEILMLAREENRAEGRPGRQCRIFLSFRLGVLCFLALLPRFFQEKEPGI